MLHQAPFALGMRHLQGLVSMRSPLPPVAAVISFIDAINRGDVDRLVALMSPDHRLQVLHEPPLAGREANRAAWHGYATAFPDYVIYPDRFVHRGPYFHAIRA